MDEGLKKRLVGATVLVSLVVIFVPMLLEREPQTDQSIQGTDIPSRPPAAFPSRVLPEADEQIAIPPPSISQAPVLRPVPPSLADVDSPTAGDAEPPLPAKPADQSPPPQVRPPLSAWVIQAGSFSNRGNANKLTQALRGKGFPAFVEQAQVQGRSVARVLVGPEVERRLAEKLMLRLNRELKDHKLVGKLKVYAGPAYRRPE